MAVKNSAVAAARHGGAAAATGGFRPVGGVVPITTRADLVAVSSACGGCPYEGYSECYQTKPAAKKSAFIFHFKPLFS